MRERSGARARAVDKSLKVRLIARLAEKFLYDD